MLWMSALEQAKRLLDLSERAQAALASPEVKEKDRRHIESYHAFRRTQPDYTPGIQKSSHLVAHNALYPREFADSIDCFGITEVCRMLAMIFFCQVFKSGYAEDGNVAGNRRDFVDTHLNSILLRAYPNLEQRASFDVMRQRVEAARDQMLAHADASAFDVTSIEIGMRCKLHSEALRGIDFSAFAIAVDQVCNALGQYARPAT